jgi:hypothetical protein
MSLNLAKPRSRPAVPTIGFPAGLASFEMTSIHVRVCFTLLSAEYRGAHLKLKNTQ